MACTELCVSKCPKNFENFIAYFSCLNFILVPLCHKIIGGMANWPICPQNFRTVTITYF